MRLALVAGWLADLPSEEGAAACGPAQATISGTTTSHTMRAGMTHLLQRHVSSSRV
jgi:hypothetical protein